MRVVFTRASVDVVASMLPHLVPKNVVWNEVKEFFYDDKSANVYRTIVNPDDIERRP